MPLLSLQFFWPTNHQNIWVDTYGLHLTINPINPANCIASDFVSSQVKLDKGLGYGTYVVSYLAPVNTMDNSVIFSPFFLYNEVVPAVPTGSPTHPPEAGGTYTNRFREIDIEVGTWAQTEAKQYGNNQFVLAPKSPPDGGCCTGELDGWKVR